MMLHYWPPHVHLAYASKAFCALLKADFKNVNQSVTTKRKVYQACVLSNVSNTYKEFKLLKLNLVIQVYIIYCLF